jgi:hypothetical protein
MESGIRSRRRTSSAEVGLPGTGLLDEQRLGVLLRQRPHLDHTLPGDLQRPPGRHQAGQVWGGPEQVGDGSPGVLDLLRVVEHEQQRGVGLPDAPRDLLDGRGLRLQVHAQRGGDALHHPRRVGGGLQFHPPCAAGEAGPGAAGDLQRGAGLAHAAERQQGDGAGVAGRHQIGPSLHLSGAPDERPERFGQSADGAGRSGSRRRGPYLVGSVSPRAEQVPHVGDEAGQVGVERRIDGVEPVDGAQVVGERPTRAHVLDAERDDGLAVLEGVLHLAADLHGRARVGGEDEHGQAALVQPGDNRLAPVGAGGDVARGDPAPDPGVLQGRPHRLRHPSVLRRVADENLARRWGGSGHERTSERADSVSPAPVPPPASTPGGKSAQPPARFAGG